MASSHAHVNIADVEDVAPTYGFGDHWEARGLRTALGAQDTGAMYFRIQPGRRSPFAHRHAEAEEIYVVLSGTGRIKLDDHLFDVRPLDAIRVDASVVRAFEAGPDGLELLAFGPHRAGDGEAVDDPWVSEPSA